jgi:hypothetical protein
MQTAPSTAEQRKKLVFISYSRQDKKTVSEYADLFRKNGLDVWIDDSSINASSLWAEQIVKAITDCDLFVLFISKAAVASDNVNKELGYAGGIGKRVLPVKIEDTEVPPAMLYHLNTIHFIETRNMSPREIVQHVLNALDEHAKTAAGPGRKPSAKALVLGTAALLALAAAGWSAYTALVGEKNTETRVSSSLLAMSPTPLELKEAPPLPPLIAELPEAAAQQSAPAPSAPQGAPDTNAPDLQDPPPATASQMPVPPLPPVPAQQESAISRAGASSGALIGFSDVKISAEFAPIIDQGEIILENGGGKIIKMPDGSVWILGVGVTAVKPGGGPMEMIRQRTVAEQKARKAIVTELEETRVAGSTTLSSITSVRESNGIETASSIDEIVNLVKSDVEGVMSGLKAAGTWLSQDGQLFHLALCKRLR